MFSEVIYSMKTLSTQLHLTRRKTLNAKFNANSIPTYSNGKTMTTVTIIQKTVRQKGEFTLHLSSP